MTLNTSTTYSIQNAFTLNLLGQIPGGPGRTGLCAWAGLTSGIADMVGWNLVQQGTDAFQIVNAHFQQIGIVAATNGDVFAYTAGAAADQIWTILPVSGLYSVYTLQNSATELYAYDPTGTGVTGLPYSAAPIDPFNPNRFYWSFLAQ